MIFYIFACENNTTSYVKIMLNRTIVELKYEKEQYVFF